MDGLKVIKSQKLYAGKVFDLIVDEVEYPSGNRGVREVAEHPGGAVVMPMLGANRVLLVKQFRYPMKKLVYELPAGKLGPGEDPAHCAARELEEETGYVAGSLRKLTAIFTSPGFCTEVLHIFLGTGLRKSDRGQHLEEGELHLTVEEVDIDDALGMIKSGSIVDAKTICGILMVHQFGLIPHH
jgi:ADP-ribose pyrophosphatase